MWKQVDVARQDSDTNVLMNLLYFGEMLLKICAAGLISSILDDRERHRYSQLHRIVRANGLGEWANAIDDTLTGPASQHLTTSARTEQRELTATCGKDTWQYESVRLLTICLKEVEKAVDDLPTKVNARRWFSAFATLRNATRGHGAPQGKICKRIAPALGESIKLITQNFSLFKRQWAYIHRNLSGRYRITNLGDQATQFEYLRSTPSATYEDGVYIHFDQHVRVELINSDAEASDFFFPNGGFNGQRFELISYFTNNTVTADASPYLFPSTALPPSRTQGIGELNVQGNAFGNLPDAPLGYVSRDALEAELIGSLLDDRHPVVTLKGGGGIGKTSLALTVLHQLAEETRYEAILWFSARDIDLLLDGPKVVKPQVLTEDEIANEFVRLLKPDGISRPGFKEKQFLASSLSISPLGAPILFVFDNFETVRNPIELYTWFDTYIRSPNKILITTRFRDFKGDYPVEVLGMSEPEARQLISEVAGELGIRRLLTEEYVVELIHESDGHPYVIKILLGEVSKAQRLVRVERIVSDRARLLESLFERTFATLSPAAKHVFLILSNWRSVIPQLALEAVMLRPANEKFDVEAAIDELRRSSLVDLTHSPEGDTFLNIPLVAAVFGKRKLSVSPLKNLVDDNTEILRFLGATQKSDIQHGITLRIERMFKHIAVLISKDDSRLKDFASMMEFLAQRHPPAWMLLARLYEESDFEDGLERAKEAVTRYLETKPNIKEQERAWQKLANLCFRTKDWTREMQAQVELCSIPETPFTSMSNTANRLNHLLFSQQFLSMEDKTAMLRQLTQVMDPRIEDDGNATDYSRLAWLYLHLHNESRARDLVVRGLQLEPTNDHCVKLRLKLQQM
jgi:NB-ARC domain